MKIKGSASKEGAGGGLWAPFRVPIGGDKDANGNATSINATWVDVLEPVGDRNKVIITTVESLIGNYGHKCTFGLLLKKDGPGDGAAGMGTNLDGFVLQSL